MGNLFVKKKTTYIYTHTHTHIYVGNLSKMWVHFHMDHHLGHDGIKMKICEEVTKMLTGIIQGREVLSVDVYGDKILEDLDMTVNLYNTIVLADFLGHIILISGIQSTLLVAFPFSKRDLKFFKL